MTEKTINILLVAAVVFLIARALLGKSGAPQTAKQQKAGAPAGFVYDFAIDGYSRIMPDGSKEYLV